jgi:Transcriptional Coactivator p15 (PC4)
MENENQEISRIATIERKGYGDKKPEEMRLSLCEYAGKPYLSLRMWWQTPAGEWAPSKKGISIRLGELQALKAALDSRELGEALKPYRRGGAPA